MKRNIHTQNAIYSHVFVDPLCARFGEIIFWLKLFEGEKKDRVYIQTLRNTNSPRLFLSTVCSFITFVWRSVWESVCACKYNLRWLNTIEFLLYARWKCFMLQIKTTALNRPYAVTCILANHCRGKLYQLCVWFNVVRSVYCLIDIIW